MVTVMVNLTNSELIFSDFLAICFYFIILSVCCSCFRSKYIYENESSGSGIDSGKDTQPAIENDYISKALKNKGFWCNKVTDVRDDGFLIDVVSERIHEGIVVGRHFSTFVRINGLLYIMNVTFEQTLADAGAEKEMLDDISDEVTNDDMNELIGTILRDRLFACSVLVDVADYGLFIHVISKSDLATVVAPMKQRSVFVRQEGRIYLRSVIVSTGRSRLGESEGNK